MPSPWPWDDIDTDSDEENFEDVAEAIEFLEPVEPPIEDERVASINGKFG